MKHLLLSVRGVNFLLPLPLVSKPGTFSTFSGVVSSQKQKQTGVNAENSREWCYPVSSDLIPWGLFHPRLFPQLTPELLNKAPALLKAELAFTLSTAYECLAPCSGAQQKDWICLKMIYPVISPATNLTLINNRESVLEAPVRTRLRLAGFLSECYIYQYTVFDPFYGSAGKPKLPCLPVNSHSGSANIYINNLIPHTWLVS